jgi:tight adherence protein B
MPVARRIRLGASPEEALAAGVPFLGADTQAAVSALSIHRETGASLIEMLAGVVRWIRERNEAAGAAGAGSAGARMSARLVAGLPLAFVPFMPATKQSLVDRTGSAILILGIGLCLIGLRWITSLIPRPPMEDQGAVIAGWVSCVLRAQGDLTSAMSAAARFAPAEIRPELEAAERRVRLGASWSVALELSKQEPIRALGRTLGRSYELGLPASDALDEFARTRRSLQRQAFEATLKRAPVTMVLPLTLCVLPAYGLLGLAPFIRGIAV